MKKIIFLFVLISTSVFSQETGLNQINNFDDIALLRNDILSIHQSSHDPTGGNADGFEKGNFPGTYNGENIMVHAYGKGFINRIWLTGYDHSDKIKIYFDGEITASIDETVGSFFSGTKAPFLSPLVVNDEVTSGGFLSYMPFPFEKEVMVTTTGNHFYNINYQLYDTNNESIKTWKGNEDLTDTYNIFDKKGDDPRGEQNYTTANNTIDVGEGNTVSAITINSQNQSASSLFLTIPELEFNEIGSNSLTDSGNATDGYSQFRMNIKSTATKVVLTRRMDYWVADQKAEVYVDGSFVGEWLTPGSDGVYRWRDVDFEIPTSFTAGKTNITIKVKFVDSMIDWNEFYYWIHCDDVLTDEIDVANTVSENAHNYSIVPKNWSGSLSSAYIPTLKDDGRAHKGYSQFIMNITPDASEYKLIRRTDFGIGNQKARVYVDGVDAGVWFSSGLDSENRWADKEFVISKDLIADGKDDITIKIEFISSDIDWNEFYYWMLSDGKLTDELDVKKLEDENIHSYTINNQLWEGFGEYTYGNEKFKTDKLLQDVSLQIFFDGETIPSVDAPIGLFFGSGTIENMAFQSLPIGILKGTNTMYCYLPMPFKNSMEVKLVNNSVRDLTGVEIEVNYKVLEHEFTKIGYLKTQYNKEYPTTEDLDYNILTANGRGKYIGVVLEGRGATNELWLEGDERFYVDECRTPVSYGTGTEDYFNGAWYFNRGPFHLATHGFTVQDGVDRTLYRFHLSDPIYFEKEGVFGIEHGPINDISANYQSLAFYYLNNETSFTLTDEVNIGNSSSETNHNYKVDGIINTQLSVIYQFEGDNDTESITESGNYIDGTSEFTVSIDANKPLKIKRMFDYSISDQNADVYVDNVFVGKWFTNGSNSDKQWREEFFGIPSAFTQNKNQITLKFVASVGEYKWSEFHYWIYSTDEQNLSNQEYLSNIISVYPNPTSRYINVDIEDLDIVSIKIVDLSGRVIKHIDGNQSKIDISELQSGTYILNIATKDGVLSTYIIKK